MKNIEIGARPQNDGVQFRVWAPLAQKVEVLLPKPVELAKEDFGYFSAVVKEAKVGDLYRYRLDGEKELPDPASRYQPEGPHGPSQVIATDYAWTDKKWQGVPLEELIIYEVHVGTFSAEGSFGAIAKHLPRLKDLGINAIEIMPIAQFAGKRNWGYDGVGLFAPQNSYGGEQASPEALKKLVNTCHENGIAVILDVVYNHLGPEGNYLPQFGHYFQNKYKTPWGDALNFDGPHSDQVRNYFLQNVRQWIEEYHLDGLRLDAIHAIMDTSAYPFLAELTDLAHDLGKKQNRQVHVIAESENNDPRILKRTAEGGLGMDAHWADDLHHVVHTLVTGENQGYYEDYGDKKQLAEVMKSGLLFQGQYSPHRQRRHGRSYKDVSRSRLVVCTQNHDQIGNRKSGERLASLTSMEKLKAGAAWAFLSGGLPLVFMGEEYGEKAPFLYFVDHTDQKLLQLVREGRKNEFAHFNWDGDVPDPGSEDTFKKSLPRWDQASQNPEAQEMAQFYKKLIALSKRLRQEKILEGEGLTVEFIAQDQVLRVNAPSKKFDMFFSVSDAPVTVPVSWPQAKMEFVSDQKTELTSGGGLLLNPYAVAVLSAK